MGSVRSASRGNWGLADTKLPGPGCTSCAAPWSGRAGTCCLVRARLMKPMLVGRNGVRQAEKPRATQLSPEQSRRTAGGLAASAFSRSEMYRQTVCFPSSKALWSSGRWFTPDGWRGYAGLAAAGYQHQVTVLSDGSDPAHEVMPRVHLVASLLKRWLIGTHQDGVQHQHLDYYLDEFTFRFNRRRSKARGLLFHRLAQQALAVGPAPYNAIVKPPGSSDSRTPGQ